MIQTQALPVFTPSGDRQVPDCYIANAVSGQTVMIAIHGISRNAAELATRIAGDRRFDKATIVAPLFERTAFGKYQQLEADREGAQRADLGLLALLDRLEAELGLDCSRIALFGFSGGAQMAHRFAMLHPARVARLCVASAGWYTLPDHNLAYPYGLGNMRPDGVAVADDFLDIPTTILVGERDTRIDESVRQDPEIIKHQGSHRLRRAKVWCRAMRFAATKAGRQGTFTLKMLPDVSHDFTASVRCGQLLPEVATALL